MKKWMFLMLLPLSLAASSSGWKHHGNFARITSVVRHQQETWITGHGGVARYNDQTQSLQFYDKVNSALPSLMVEDMAIHPQTGDIWIGTYDNGIARLNGNTFEHFTFPLPDAKLYSICFTPAGKLFIANSRGVFEFLETQNDWRPLILVGPSSASPCWDMDALPDGRLACAGSQPFILHPDNDSIAILNSSGIAYSTSTIRVLNNNTLAFGTDHGVLSILVNETETDTFELEHPIDQIEILDGKTVVHLRYQNTVMIQETNGWETLDLGNNEVEDFTTEGNKLWAASAGENGKILQRTLASSSGTFPLRASGLNTEYNAHLRTTESGDILIANARPQLFNLANQQFTTLWTTPFPSQVILDVIWWNNRYLVGTSTNGLWEFTTAGGWNRIGASELPGMNAENFAIESQNGIWFSGNGYLARYNGSQLEVFTETETPLLTSNLMIRELLFDSYRNTLFAATYDGIISYSNGQFNRIDESTHPHLQYYDAVHSITAGPDHSIWFGTVYGGIISYNGTDYTLEMLPLSAGNQYVSDLVFHDDTLYVSDNLNGVWKKANGSWTNWNDKNSALSSSSVRSLAIDREGSLWIFTNLGLDQKSAAGVFQNVEPVSKPFSVSVFPNPCRNELNLSLPEAGIYSVELFDFSGRKLFEKTMNSEDSGLRLQLPGLSSGLYWMSIKNARKEKFNTRIMVE